MNKVAARRGIDRSIAKLIREIKEADIGGTADEVIAKFRLGVGSSKWMADRYSLKMLKTLASGQGRLDFSERQLDIVQEAIQICELRIKDDYMELYGNKKEYTLTVKPKKTGFKEMLMAKFMN